MVTRALGSLKRTPTRCALLPSLISALPDALALQTPLGLVNTLRGLSQLVALKEQRSQLNALKQRERFSKGSGSSSVIKGGQIESSAAAVRGSASAEKGSADVRKKVGAVSGSAGVEEEWGVSTLTAAESTQVHTSASTQSNQARTVRGNGACRSVSEAGRGKDLSGEREEAGSESELEGLWEEMGLLDMFEMPEGVEEDPQQQGQQQPVRWRFCVGQQHTQEGEEVDLRHVLAAAEVRLLLSHAFLCSACLCV